MNKMYVCFDYNTGEITRITNKVEQNENYVEVDSEDVRPLQTGEELTSSYIVKYNLKDNIYEFKAKDNFEVDSLDINDIIYKIPEDTVPDADLTIIQDFENTCWKFYIGKNFKKNITNQVVNLNRKLHFSITAKDDPNVLYKTFILDFAETVRQHYAVLPFTELFEYEPVDISIYTTKKFNTYQFKRIKDGK